MVCLGCALACGGDTTAVVGTDTGTSGSSGVETTTTVSVDSTADTSTGTTTTLSSASSSSSSEADSVATFSSDDCGNGIVDPGEECDDGDTIDGDTCSAVCTSTVEVVWTISHDGPFSGSDGAYAVLVDADDNIYVGGKMSVGLDTTDLWLQQYASDGAPGWTFTYDGPDGLSDGASTLAWTDDGGIAIGGATTSSVTGSDALVMVIEADTQEIRWSQIIDGPGVGAGLADRDRVEQVAIDPHGNLVFCGFMPGADTGEDVWIAEFASDGALRWEQIWDDGEAGDDGPNAVGVTADGRVLVLLTQEVADDGTQVVLTFDDDGALLPAETLELERSFFPWTFELLDGDDLFALGSAMSGIVVARVDPDWSVQWKAAGPAGFGFALGHDALEQPSAAGFVDVGSADPDAWAGGFRADGTPWWGDVYDNADVHGFELWQALAVDSHGDVIVAGAENTATEDYNALVRKYHPL
jgi:cysteine-rich repeat protein